MTTTEQGKQPDPEETGPGEQQPRLCPSRAQAVCCSHGWKVPESENRHMHLRGQVSRGLTSCFLNQCSEDGIRHRVEPLPHKGSGSRVTCPPTLLTQSLMALADRNSGEACTSLVSTLGERISEVEDCLVYMSSKFQRRWD